MNRNLFFVVIGTALVLVSSVFARSAQAGQLLVSVDVKAPNSYSGPGAAQYAGSPYWNELTVPSITGLLESDGVTNSGINLAVSNSNGTFNNTSPAFAPGLMGDYVYTFNQGASPAVFTLTNVPAGKYDLYIYSDNGASHTAKTAFTVNGSSPQVVAGSATVPTAPYTSFVAGGNFTEFLAVSSISGTITGTFYDASTNAASFNGFQLVAVPEPASLVMIGLSAVSLLYAARRRMRS